MNLKIAERLPMDDSKFSRRPKIKKSSPVLWLCEYHHDVLEHIHQAIRRRQLPFSKTKILHFDSHPDLMFPVNVDADVCFQTDVLYDEVGIADWILPLVYANHVNSVLWIKPPWATQIKEGSYDMIIGKEKKNKGLRVTCQEDYFIEELLYSSPSLLDAKSDLNLQVFTIRDLASLRCLYSPSEDCPLKVGNMEPFSTSKKVDSPKSVLDKLQRNKDSSLEDLDVTHLDCKVKNLLSPEDIYVLDIDLDFFSTQNPFQLLFDEDFYQKLESLYQYQTPLDSSAKAMDVCLQKRKSQLDCLDQCFKHVMNCAVQIDSNETRTRCFNHFHVNTSNSDLAEQCMDLLKTYCGKMDMRMAKGDLDLELVQFAGLCGKLPHHVSSIEEIDLMMDQVRSLLLHFPTPALITIARSTVDDYTPEDQVEMIQEKLLNLLNNIYDDIIVHKAYENEDQEWD